MISTAVAVVNLAQGRNAVFLGVIQGGSGRPDRRVPIVAAGHLLQAWVGGATQSARASVAVVRYRGHPVGALLALPETTAHQTTPQAPARGPVTESITLLCIANIK